MNIVAPVPANPLKFMGWTGDTTFVTDVSALSTTVIMPASNLSLRATYSNPVSARGPDAGQRFYCYPNPANVDFSINLVNMGESSIDICNLLGQSVYRSHTAEPEHLVQNQQLSSGIYVIRVLDGMGEVHTQKLIIQ